MTSNATPIEVAYTLVMLVGLIISGANVLWANARLAELTMDERHGTIGILREGARADQIKVSVMFLFLAFIGVISTVTPPNPNVTFNGIISGLLFIVVGFMLIWISVDVRLRPASLRRAIGREEGGR